MAGTGRRAGQRRSKARNPGGRPTPGTSRRVTPKGTSPTEHRPEPSRRYTPPDPHLGEGPSPRWVPILMFGLLGLGAAVIILNYLGVLPGSTDNLWLLAGLLLVTGGFITATRYR